MVVIEELDEIDEGGDEEEHDGEAQGDEGRVLNEDFLILMGQMKFKKPTEIFESKYEEKMQNRDQTILNRRGETTLQGEEKSQYYIWIYLGSIKIFTYIHVLFVYYSSQTTVLSPSSFSMDK